MSTSTDTMKTFFNVLKLYAYDTTTDGVAILDQAVSTVSRFSSLQDVVNRFVTTMAVNLLASGDNPAQAIYDTCGIIIGDDGNLNVDTGAPSGYYLGGDTVKNAQDIVLEPNVDLSQFALPEGGSTTAHSYTGADGQTFNYTITYPTSILEVVDIINSPKEVDESTGESERVTALAPKLNLQAGQVYVSMDSETEVDIETPARTGEEIAPSIVTMTKGVESYWVDAALKLIYDEFGLDFNGKNLNIRFGINQDSSAVTSIAYDDIAARTGVPATNLNVAVNSVMYTPLDPSNVNGSSYVPNGNMGLYTDRLLAHELVHATMMASGTLKNGMPQFFTEGVADFVQGNADSNSGSTKAELELASDPDELLAALEFKEGTGTPAAYAAGCMLLAYMCHQSLNTQLAIGTGTAPELFTYTGGEEILSGEADGSQVNFAAGIEATETAAGEEDMAIGTTAGNLIIRKARGKLLNFANDSGTVTARSYLANYSGIVDGRNFDEYEFICGANYSDNEIYAGNGGSRLWGGSFGMDMLVGGAGADEFIVGVGCGSDIVNGVDSNDVINLATTTLDQITGINATSSGVSMSFEDGSEVSVIGNNEGTNYNFKLADGSAYTYNSGEWTKTA